MTIEGKMKVGQFERERKVRPAFTFIRDMKEELKLISWTSKADLKKSTKLVVGATFIFGLGIYLTDLVLKGSLETLKLLFHWVFG